VRRSRKNGSKHANVAAAAAAALVVEADRGVGDTSATTTAPLMPVAKAGSCMPEASAGR
jgi:hypothetical protein